MPRVKISRTNGQKVLSPERSAKGPQAPRSAPAAPTATAAADAAAMRIRRLRSCDLMPPASELHDRPEVHRDPEARSVAANPPGGSRRRRQECDLREVRRLVERHVVETVRDQHVL